MARKNASDIRPGDRVTIVDRFGKERTGRAVMRGPHGWVLNMGGKHGTPGIADERNIVKVSAKRGGLGSSTKEHASAARGKIASVQHDLTNATKGSCSLRFTSLMSAQSTMGQVWAHAFGAGGKVSRGALSKKTVSDVEAKRVYDTADALDSVANTFRRDCLSSGVNSGVGRRSRRKRNR